MAARGSVDRIRRDRRPCAPIRCECGSATAETAVLLPALAVALAVSLWGLGVVGDQLRCMDAARTAARALARGEPEPLARQAALEAAPDGARVGVSRHGGLVVVEVVVRAEPLGRWAVGSIDLRSRAVAAAEEP